MLTKLLVLAYIIFFNIWNEAIVKSKTTVPHSPSIMFHSQNFINPDFAISFGLDFLSISNTDTSYLNSEITFVLLQENWHQAEA